MARSIIHKRLYFNQKIYNKTSGKPSIEKNGILNSKLPSVGDYVTTDDGLKGEVSSVSVLRQEVKVIVTVNKDEKEIREYKVSQLKFRPHKRREKTQLSDKELKELEDLDRLDKREGRSKLNDK